jgi:hypothetical protein
MRTLKLNIPDSLEIDDREVSMLVASRLYEQLLTVGLRNVGFLDLESISSHPTFV